MGHGWVVRWVYKIQLLVCSWDCNSRGNYTYFNKGVTLTT